MNFKKDFIFGTATAAYQIEGAAFEDGKGPSVWDVFCTLKDRVSYGDTGEFCCDHYHRYKEDFAILKELGIKDYRFSISWPRILPEGTGKINQKGIDFYNRLIDEMLTNDVTPYASIFHWDYPYALHQKGGWLNPDSSKWFEEYTEILVKNFSDRIQNWFTLNEALGVVNNSYGNGSWAPGYTLDKNDLIPITHNMLLSHGGAVKVINSMSKNKEKPKCGFVSVGSMVMPENDNNEKDIEYAYNMTFDPKVSSSLGWWLDPIYLGNYPKEGLELYEKFLPKNWQDDMATISQDLTWCTTNIYRAHRVRKDANGNMEKIEYHGGFPRNSFEWPIVPEAIYWLSKFLYKRYKKPVFITENGMCNCDFVSMDGKVHDPQRIDFTRRYLLALDKAAGEGVDIAGYLYWSLLDNFEWQKGYSKRFGLVYVNYETYERTIKDSGYWYSKVVRSGGKYLEENPF